MQSLQEQDEELNTHFMQLKQEALDELSEREEKMIRLDKKIMMQEKYIQE